MLYNLFRLIPYLFTALAFGQLALVNQSTAWWTWGAPLILLGCGLTGQVALPNRDRLLWPLVTLLNGLGLVMIARLAPNFLPRQLLWMTVATALVILINRGPHQLNWLRQFKYSWMFGGLALLATTIVAGVNPSGYGARLWLSLGGFYIQPSEPLKLFLVVFLAAYMADRHRQLSKERTQVGPLRVPDPSYWWPMLMMWGLSMLLLVWQRDLGAALLFFGTFIGMVFGATGQIRYVIVGLGLLLIAGGVGYGLFDVVRLRTESFWNPWADSQGQSFQIVQSLLAFASGGLFGQGLGQGLPTAIPVVHTDFVFAALSEEYGLLGGVAVLLCFVLLINRALVIAQRARNRFEQLLAGGIAIMLALQTLIITAGTLKLMPLTGVTLPFVSYGGSSLVTCMAMIGLLLFIARGQSMVVTSPFAGHHRQIGCGLNHAFSVIAGGLLLWHTIIGPFMLDRQDNPRPVVKEQTVQRGTIFDRTGQPLAYTEILPSGLSVRHYPHTGFAPVTGYHSLRYGVVGAEAQFNRHLRGTTSELDQFLHRRQIGQSITVTIDLPVQQGVVAELAGYQPDGAGEGAIVILDVEAGTVVALASWPTYDPNQLDENWATLRDDGRAPLLNRATQGLYPVGELARLIGLVGRWHTSNLILRESPTRLLLNQLIDPLGPTGYAGTAYQLGLMDSLRWFRTSPSRLPDFTAEGSYPDLAVPPIHFARLLVAIEQGGQLPQPRLALSQPPASQPIFAPQTGYKARTLFQSIGDQLIGLPAIATPEETGQDHYLSWFIGLYPTQPNQLPPPPERQDLIFDPAKIPNAPASPRAVSPPNPVARYAIVAVLVTAQSEPELASEIVQRVVPSLP